jgi:hypothetical protein
MMGRFFRENTMRQFILASLLSALLLVPGGCAGRPADTQATAPTRNRDIIPREELDRGQWANAYEAVRNLRPQWLRVRGRDTINGEPGTVQVVLDDVRLGGPEALRTLPLTGVSYFQWLDGISASQRWGTGFGNGAILISTRPR